MSKAEKFIKEHQMDCTNESIKRGEYYHWITPDQARKAVEIARKEMYKWLENNLALYNACNNFVEKRRLLKDLKQAMKDE